ncbi:hypothetical protein C5167_035118 [Papaver somniferum]|uniref:Uncharacterized protein n=1 Tax=Papaver somniferum TaxID=3469 RepID=A0A4Y7KIP9_PAPSO|nr:hypothetical protein C5167_035118 [Papaver somniferum]
MEWKDLVKFWTTEEHQAKSAAISCDGWQVFGSNPLEEQENGLVIQMIEVFRHLVMPRHFTNICDDTRVSNKNRTLVVQYYISKASNMVVVILSFLSSYVNLKKFGGDTPYSLTASSLMDASVAFARAGYNAVNLDPNLSNELIWLGDKLGTFSVRVLARIAEWRKVWPMSSQKR